MNFISGKCPKCSGELQIPEGHESVICMYCGEKIFTSDAANHTGEEKPESIKNPLTEELCKETVDSLKQKLADMLFEVENPMESFSKKAYEQNFTAYCNKFCKVFEEIDDKCSATDSRESYLQQISEGFLSIVEEKLNQIPKRGKRDEKLLDYNMVMVVFVFPALLEQKSVANQELAKVLAESWKEHFQQTNIKPITYDQINGGFKKRFCYITTAVCESLDKPDDCYELNLLRSYRDGYLMSRTDGEELVRQYYDVAPTIVKHIDRREDSGAIYKAIWETYLSPCISLIESERNTECMEIYQNMVYDLKNKYFS